MAKAAEKTSGKSEKQSGIKARVQAFRENHVWFDRAMRTQEQYSQSRGNQLAGGVTYFGFLSLFPLLAISFAVVGYLASLYGGLQGSIENFLVGNLPPGMVATEEGNSSAPINTAELSGDANTLAAVGFAGVAGLLYSGLGWLEALREALRQMWSVAPSKASIVKRKLKDVLLLVMLGGAILGATALSTVASSLTGQVLELVGIDSTNGLAQVGLTALAIGLAISATTVILLIIFSRLPGHRLPWKNLISGALLGAIAIEIIKLLATRLISGTADNNAVYGAFAVIIALLVWINFVARAVMYAAAWCVVGPVPTVEDQVSDKGETLSEDEAQAASKARKHANDEGDSVPVGKKHSTTAGNVSTTTTGLPAGKWKNQDSEKSPAGDGELDAPEKSTRKSASKAESTASQRGKQTSKGSILSFAGVLALVAMRYRRQARVG